MNPAIERRHPNLSTYQIIMTGEIIPEKIKDLASFKTNIILAVKDLKKARITVENITNSTGNNYIEVQHLDLNSLKSLQEFAHSYLASKRSLNILVNNSTLLFFLVEEAKKIGKNFKAVSLNTLGKSLAERNLKNKNKNDRINIIEKSCANSLKVEKDLKTPDQSLNVRSLI